jgi:hypothetical protein
MQKQEKIQSIDYADLKGSFAIVTGLRLGFDSQFCKNQQIELGPT